MGKYMKKAKITCDVAVMEVVSESTLGVRTRAKTLALQKQTPSSPEISYLQLRSRRLEKVLPSPNDTKKQQQSPSREENPSPNYRSRKSQRPSPRSTSRLRPTDSGSIRSVSVSCSKNGAAIERELTVRASQEDEPEDCCDLSVEPSFGDNNIEFDARGRSTRESTPCSFIREPAISETVGSTTGHTSSTATNRRAQRSNLAMPEIEEFFAAAEEQQQRLFSEKYNFDVVNDVPLPGRFEWVRVDQL